MDDTMIYIGAVIIVLLVILLLWFVIPVARGKAKLSSSDWGKIAIGFLVLFAVIVLIRFFGNLIFPA